jgi:hypothetical protein
MKTNEENSVAIVNAAQVGLDKIDKWAIGVVHEIAPVIVKYYYASEATFNGVEFLRDAVRYLDSRNEALNENKNWLELLHDFAKKVDFDKTRRF